MLFSMHFTFLTKIILRIWILLTTFVSRIFNNKYMLLVNLQLLGCINGTRQTINKLLD